jgi:hypothetical protein
MYKRNLAKGLSERFVIDRGWKEEQAIALGQQVLRGNVDTIFAATPMPEFAPPPVEDPIAAAPFYDAAAAAAPLAETPAMEAYLPEGDADLAVEEEAVSIEEEAVSIEEEAVSIEEEAVPIEEESVSLEEAIIEPDFTLEEDPPAPQGPPSKLDPSAETRQLPPQEMERLPPR